MNSILNRLGTTFAAVLAAVLSLPAHAGVGTLPPERQAGDASFVSGGVGEGEARRFEAAAAHYPLTVRLFEAGLRHAEYTVNALVKITDTHGRVVLDERAEGPFMLVRLPAGDYRVSASMHDRAVAEHGVHVTHSGHATTTFVFPRSVG